MNARPLIDSLSFAQHSQSLHGEIAVNSLPRLHDSLLQTNTVLQYSVLGKHEARVNFLHLTVSGSLILMCQRCLGELKFELSIDRRLPLLTAAELAVDEEWEDAIEASAELDVMTLLEDEIVLALPYAAKHADESCHFAAKNLTESASPFAGLAVLKTK